MDVWDVSLMTTRPWPWLRTRVLGLLTSDTRTARSLVAKFQPTPV